MEAKTSDVKVSSEQLAISSAGVACANELEP